MISTSSRLSFFALAIYVASAVTAAKPYAAELSARGVVVERTVAASRPYADSIYARSEEDPIQIKRSEASASWTAFNVLASRSEEEMHARGQVDDAVIEKRGKCYHDYMCGDGKYCSQKTNRCYKLLKNGAHCVKNHVCASDYCNNNTDKCHDKRANGSVCKGNDAACASNYCSVKTNLCRAKTGKGSACLATAGCDDGLSCVNKKCVKDGKGSTTPTGPSGPSPSSPASSGTPSKRINLERL